MKGKESSPLEKRIAVKSNNLGLEILKIFTFAAVTQFGKL